MNHFLAVAVAATQQSIEGSDSKKKKKKTQQGSDGNTERLEQLCDGEIGDWLGPDWRLWDQQQQKQDRRRQKRDRRRQKRDQEIRISTFNVPATAAPPLTSGKYFSSFFFSGFPYLISLSLSLNTQSDLCCNLWVLWVRLIFWQYCLVFVFLCKCM